MLRCYATTVKVSKEDQVELYGVSDASGDANDAVVYVVNVRTRNPTIVTSKSKVAPLKETSIPRLELLGALVLSKLIVKVRTAMNKVVTVHKIHCWTDSDGSVVLAEQSERSKTICKEQDKENKGVS